MVATSSSNYEVSTYVNHLVKPSRCATEAQWVPIQWKHSWSNLTSCWQWTADGFVYVLQEVDRAVETLHVVMISTGAKISYLQLVWHASPSTHRRRIWLHLCNVFQDLLHAPIKWKNAQNRVHDEKNKHIPTTLNIIMSDGEHSDGCYRTAVHNCIKMVATKGEECSVQRHQDIIEHRMHVN